MVNVFMIKILMPILGFVAGDEIAPNGLEKIVLPYHLLSINPAPYD
jgi:hypothetical protein